MYMSNDVFLFFFEVKGYMSRHQYELQLKVINYWNQLYNQKNH